MRTPRTETEPAPGLYVDTTGVHYVIYRHPKLGWMLDRDGHVASKPFAYADFARAVREGIFTPVLTPNKCTPNN